VPAVLLEGQIVGATSRAGRITIFSVLWFCVFALCGLGLSALFHPENPLIGVGLFVVGFLAPFVISQLVIRVFGKRTPFS
jgi:hypothetical protein